MKVFVDLYDKGLIYRDNYMVNWDPGSRSAISDLEVEDREVTDTLYYVDYPLASGGGSLTVATVRPETMLADTAIAVHPDDERYTRLVGETAILPIVGRRLRIIADPYVKPEFGTGALKITPGHDPNDFEIGRAHGLEEIVVIGEDGRMNEHAGERFAGLTALEAREAVVAALREEGAIARTEPYVHAVPFSHRSGERIEPLISPAVVHEDGRAGRARDRGGRGRPPARAPREPAQALPRLARATSAPGASRASSGGATRSPSGTAGEETYVGTEPPEGDGWERDPDVLDTWFSSGLWPFATLGWPDDTPELRAFYPTDVLSTGRDILFLWVARMVMLGIEFTGEVPFTDVYNHSTILAPDGRRMSKSLGTGIDPLDVIDQHGADGTRFGLLAMSSTQDVRFSEEKVAQGRQLANKLFNASRLVLLRAAPGVGARRRPAAAGDGRGRVDPLAARSAPRRRRRARSRRSSSTAPSLGLYDFVYGELCDWYLEIVKPRLYADDNEAVSAFALGVLAETLAIAHPVIPFVTEEIWSHLPGARRPADGARAGPRPTTALIDPDGRGGAGAGDRRGAGAARLARPDRRRARRRAAGAAGGRRATSARPSTSRGWRGWSGPATASRPPRVAVPGGTIAVLPSDAVDLGAAARRIEERARLAGRRDRARREEARPTRASWPRRPTAVVAAERDKLARLREERDGL